MTLGDFMKVYGGGACVSIKGYCEEREYDYYWLPSPDVENFQGNNPNHYIPSCIEKEPWWPEAKDREIKNFQVIGGGEYRVELVIFLV